MRSGIRIIGSFLLISLVVILALTGGAYVLYGDYSRSQLRDQYWIALSAAQSEADKTMERIEDYVRQLTDLTVFYASEGDAADTRDSRIVSLVQRFQDHIALDVEAVIFLRDTPKYIYTDAGKLKYTDYEAQLLDGGINPDLNGLFSAMLSAQQPELHRVQESEKLMYILPIGDIWSAYQAVLMVMMDQSLLTDCFVQEALMSAGGAYAIGGDGTLLLSRPAADGTLYSARELSGALAGGVRAKTINGVGMVIACKKSDTGLMTYVSALPETMFYGEWYALSRRLLSVILIVAIFAVVLSVAMGIANYLPLRKAYTRITGRPPKGRADELDAIVNSFERTQDSMLALEDRQESNLGIIRRQLLLAMIGNQIRGTQEFENFKKSLQLNLNQPWWCALFISPRPSGQGKSQIDRILLALEELFLPRTEMIFAERRWEQGVGIVVNFSADDPGAGIAEIAQGVMRRICAQMPEDAFTLGVGSVEETPTHINLSFYRATSAAQSAPPSFESRVIFFKEAQGGDSFALDTSLLAEGITYGNAEVALSSFHLAMEQIENSREYLPMIRLMCGDILSTILHCAQKGGLPLDRALLFSAAEYATLEEFSERAARLIEQLCAVSGQRRSEDAQQDRARLVAYIADQYKRNDLSLRLLSDETQLSMSKINQLLKESTGCSFVQYVWLLRVSEVKRLLRETDNNIQSIVQMVGYIDVSSFMRRFKASEGVSPGQYRQQYRKE